MSETATLVAAVLGGGLSGGIATTWMTTNHQRREADRTRGIAAADDFLVVAAAARLACVNLGAAVESWLDDTKVNPITTTEGGPTRAYHDRRVAKLIDEAEETTDRTYAAAFRLAILFPKETGVFDAAMKNGQAFRNWQIACSNAAPTTEHPVGINIARALAGDAYHADQEFFEAVRRAVIKPRPFVRVRRIASSLRPG